MALTNLQHDKIIQVYKARQISTAALIDARTEEVYQKVPEYKEIVDEITSLNVQITKNNILGNEENNKALKERIEDLRTRKKLVLTQNGFSITYLDPTYVCPYCKDTGYIDGEKCHCFKQAMMDMLYEQSNIKAVLEEENFDNIYLDFQVGEDREHFIKAYEKSLEFCDNFEKEFNNMFFYGDSGTGKTYLTNCIVNEIIAKGHMCIYFSSIELFNRISEYKFNKSGKDFVANPYDDIYNCDLLVIDDLGSEIVNALTISELFSIINERILRNKSTIISSNFDLAGLQDKYSDKITSRIIGKYTLCKLTGNNIRVILKRRSERK